MWNKIKSIFKEMFGYKEESLCLTTAKDEMVNEKNIFKEEIKYQDADKELLELQIQFESGKIKEEDLTEEQAKNLRDLYNKQIEKLNGAIDNYKKEILKIKKRLNS